VEPEILLYLPIEAYTAQSFIAQLNFMGGEDAVVRVNSPGGSVYKGWGIVAKSVEYPGNLKFKVDGNASSMSAILLLFHDNVEASEVATFTLHRASIRFPNENQKKELKDINTNIRKALESKLDVSAFEAIAGVDLDRFFDIEQDAVDVYLTAEQAETIGLVGKVNPLTRKEFEALNEKFVAYSRKKETPKAIEKPKNNKKMTKEELKSKHPEVYASIFAEGESAERDRVEAWMVFNEVDAKAVAEGITSGNVMGHKDMAEFNKKAATAQYVAAVKEDGDDGVDPANPTPVASAKKEEIKAFEEEVMSNIKNAQ